ncbi:MAG: hypothetical protein NVSMB56_02390 [Pyrinomonadaceae bacterium]
MLLVFILHTSLQVNAHPLGNFTVNHFTRIETSDDRVRVRFVVDMAEIPTLQELQNINREFVKSNEAMTQNLTTQNPPRAALDAYAARAAQDFANQLVLTVDGVRVPLQIVAQNISLPAGAGGLPTMRIECEFFGAIDASKTQTTNSRAQTSNANPPPLNERISNVSAMNFHRLHFEDLNHPDRIGWREIVVAPSAGITVFNSNAYGNGITNELKSYPENMLAAPLNERTAELSYARGAIPNNAKFLQTRDGKTLAPQRDRLAELINDKELTYGGAVLGLLLAIVLGAAHAFSPGHGKTVVGAYLVGSRGTAKHAAFLGLTVTVTHTAGVFALGLITLFASQYILPEKLFPILSLVSGGIVFALGVSLFFARLRATFGVSEHTHALDESGTHSHDGGGVHSHLPPGVDGNRVSWKNLLALGVSGGLLPCPSALVVLLAAITLGRVAYGLALVVAFSLGLAATLTSIGLAFVYAGRFIKTPTEGSLFSSLTRVLPVLSAFVIACVGAVLCHEALTQTGINLFDFSELRNVFNGTNGEAPELAKLSAFSVLTLGAIFGLKHATEVDHVVAVSSIVSEHRNIFRAGLVGGLWGAGHTLSLIIVGFVVLALRVAIPEHIAAWLEFGVALMIIGLGVNALIRALRGRTDVHAHTHAHDGLMHAHLHFHEDDVIAADEPLPIEINTSHAHAIKRIGIKPLIVGMMHGLAGSAALTLLVLSQIGSMSLGLLYLFVFGVGSIFGMLLMSSLIGLPFVLSAHRLTRFNYVLQTLAGALSIAFGLWYAYETGLK